MNYVKNIRFDERPDYNFLKGLFIDLLQNQFNEKYFFDWIIMEKINEKNKKLSIDKKIEEVNSNRSKTESPSSIPKNKYGSNSNLPNKVVLEELKSHFTNSDAPVFEKEITLKPENLNLSDDDSQMTDKLEKIDANEFANVLNKMGLNSESKNQNYFEENSKKEANDKKEESKIQDN